MSAYVTGEETKGFTCPGGSLTPNEKGFIEITTSNQLVCGQEVKEITIAPGVEGTVIEHNWLHGFEETGNHTDGWQNVWGGEDAVFSHNVISDFVGEGTLLKDGDVTNVRYEDNLVVESGTNEAAPEGEFPLQTVGVHGIELIHNTYASNALPGELIRAETTGSTAKYNVFDNLELLEGGELTESQNNLDIEPWSFFPDETDVFGTPTFNADWQTTKKAQDGTTLGIDFPASEVRKQMPCKYLAPLPVGGHHGNGSRHRTSRRSKSAATSPSLFE